MNNIEKEASTFSAGNKEQGILKYPIHLTGLSSISALGGSIEEVWRSYQTEKHLLSHIQIGEQSVWAAPLSEKLKEEIKALRNSDSKYKNLDDSVLFAIHTSRRAIANASWCFDSAQQPYFGVNVGSSRGATSLFEKYHREYLEGGNSSTLASPTTTLGNLSSWVAHDLKTKGPEISHSITCSTALHALLNGVAWLQSGLANKFLVGGSEAPLTPFTLAQMQALKIYTRGIGLGQNYPCKALDLNKTQNTMVLGEGSAMACLESGTPKHSLAQIIGIGYATEPLRHNVSISADAQCFQESMKMALGATPPEEVDAVVMHAPGTVKGDKAEYRAIEKVFCNKIPFLTTNKWKVGHTFGTSGMLSVEMAVLMLQRQQPIKVPFINNTAVPASFSKIMINAVGFGGNAATILLKNPNYK